MNKLIVLSGVPGSGKSYFSNALKAECKGRVFIISSDALRKEITGDQRDLSKDREVWVKYYDIAKELAKEQDAIVIMDATHAKKVFRLDNIKPYRGLYNQIDLICFQLDKELVLKQNKEREFPIPEEALLKLIDEYVMPDQEERDFYDHVDIIKDHNTKSIIKRYL